MALIGDLLNLALNIYMWIILISVAVSWLIAFEVINTRNPQAANLVNLLGNLTEPVYKPVRKYIPPIGGIDLTPIVIIIAIYVLQTIISRVFY